MGVEITLVDHRCVVPGTSGLGDVADGVLIALERTVRRQRQAPDRAERDQRLTVLPDRDARDLSCSERPLDGGVGIVEIDLDDRLSGNLADFST